MNILWHMPTLQRACCGLSRRAVGLATGLQTHGMNVEFAVAPGKTDVLQGQVEGIRVRLLPLQPARTGHWTLQAVAKARTTRRAIRTLPPDHDVFISCQPEAINAYAEQRPLIPAIFVCGGLGTLHDPWQADSFRHRPILNRMGCHVDRLLRRRNERGAMRAAARVIFDSRSTMEYAIQACGMHRDQCEVIRAAVDPDAFMPASPVQRAEARAGLLLSSDQPAIVWMGRLSPEKNLPLLLRSLGRIRERAWRLFIVGDGPERAALEQSAASLGIVARVRFLGARQDMRPFLHAADLFVFPSVGESCGCALVEAMACGVAAVALRPNDGHVRTANAEIIEHGRTGWLVDSAEPEAFAAAIGCLLDDPSFRADLGSRARESVCERFSWRAGAARLAGLLDEVARPRRDVATMRWAAAGSVAGTVVVR